MVSLLRLYKINIFCTSFPLDSCSNVDRPIIVEESGSFRIGDSAPLSESKHGKTVLKFCIVTVLKLACVAAGNDRHGRCMRDVHDFFIHGV